MLLDAPSSLPVMGMNRLIPKDTDGEQQILKAAQNNCPICRGASEAHDIRGLTYATYPGISMR
jgi:hypothetical protein